MERIDKVLTLMALVVIFISAGVLASRMASQRHMDSYIKVSTVAHKFATTHTYVEDVYDCDEASIDLANEYRALGYNATLMIGNPLEDVHGDLYKINHAWVLLQVNGRWIAVESTNGHVNLTSPLYYNGWPVQVDDYDAWMDRYMNYHNSDKMQSYQVPFPETA